MGGLVIARKPRKGEGDKARDKENTRGEQKSRKCKDIINVGGAGRVGGWRLRLGNWEVND